MAIGHWLNQKSPPPTPFSSLSRSASPLWSWESYFQQSLLLSSPSSASTSTYRKIISTSVSSTSQSSWRFQNSWKNISQNGNLSQIGVKIRTIWNHQPAIYHHQQQRYHQNHHQHPNQIIISPGQRNIINITLGFRTPLAYFLHPWVSWSLDACVEACKCLHIVG